MIDALGDLLASDGFRSGVLYGALAAAAVAAAAVLAARWGRPVLPWAGLAFGAATVLALEDRFGVTADFVAGLALLALGALLSARLAPPLRLAAAVPGAVAFAAASDLDDPGWATPTIVGVTLVGGVLVADSDRWLGRTGLPPLLLAITTLGIYGTTPDTEHSSILVGAAVPLVVLGWPRPLASLGVAGSFVAVALVAWDVVLDGMPRPGAVVGGMACLGMLAIEPLSRRASRPKAGRASPEVPPLFMLALHGGVVVVASRVAGLLTSALAAAAIAAAALAVAAALAIVVANR